jgi:catechol 2,3-dioxygenase-like lactoylglutathione lyase family enzyme
MCEERVNRQPSGGPTRRHLLQLLGVSGAALLADGSAESADLPLRTTGLEHIGMTVPDQEAAAKFYGHIFDPQLFQERDPPPRFYVRTGISYIAFGGGTEMPPRIDHFCALVEDLKPQEMRKMLEDAGIPVTGRGALGMPADPDGIRLQLLGVPGGLARTIIPSSRITQDDPAVQAIGFDHIMLAVSDVEKSAAYYRRFFGVEVSRSRKPERAWFAVARTRLGLETVSSGKAPGVDHVCFRVAGFDRRAASQTLKKLNAEIISSNDEGLLRFRDPNGLVMELKAGG